MPHAGPTRLSRRDLLSAAGAVGLGALATACGGSGSDQGQRANGTGGSWSFTDDRRQKVSLDNRPDRLVTYVGTAAALHDFGVDKQVVGVFGPTKQSNGQPDPLAGDIDVDKMTVLGNTFGEFNIEKYASLRPELLVTAMWEPKSLWFVPEESKDKILPLAPSVGLSVADVSLLDSIQRHAALAESLGADLQTKKVTEAKGRFEAAAQSLRKATKANRGLKVMTASASPDILYVSDPAAYADLSYFRSLGVEFVVPDKVVGGFFENLSWENADKYAADLILLDKRTSALQPESLTSKPTWSQLPAVRAEQIVPWLSEPRMSYAGSAPILESLASGIQSAKKVI